MIRDAVHTAATYGATFALTSTLAPLAALVALPDPHNADAVIRLYARGLLAAAGVRLVAHGVERLPEGSCVMACNHQSNFDPLVLAALVHKHMRFVAKAELFSIPVFGQAMRAVGMVKVDRTGSEADRRALRKAVDAVRQRVSLLFFPEGTRSSGGTLGPFKKGAAVMAIQAGVPLVPMAVAGTCDILPPKSRWIRAGQKVVLRVGEPLPTRGLTELDRDALTERLHAAVAALLEEAEAEAREAT